MFGGKPRSRGWLVLHSARRPACELIISNPSECASQFTLVNSVRVIGLRGAHFFCTRVGASRIYVGA